MRNKIIMLAMVLICFAGIDAKANWYITIGSQSSAATNSIHLCTQLPYGTYLIYVYDANGNSKTSVSKLYITQNNGVNTISPLGSWYSGYGYLIQDPVNNYYASGTGINYGTYTIAIYNGNAYQNSVTLYLEPNAQGISNVVSPNNVSGVGSSATFLINTNNLPFPLYGNPTWSVTNGFNGNTHCYWTGSVNSSGNYIVTPQPQASLQAGWSAQVNSSFITGSGSCNANKDNTNNFGRAPIVTSTVPNGGVICTNSILSINVADNQWYPNMPPGGVYYSKEVHFTVDWYKNNAYVASGFTYVANSPGAYYANVKEYHLNANQTAYNTTPATTIQSNTITLNAPLSGTLSPTATINSTSLTNSMTATTPHFFTCGSNTLTFSGSGGSATYSYKVEIISGTSGATLTTVSQGLGAVPTNLNITSAFNNAQSGYYGIKLTVSDGCNSQTYIGYLYINSATPPSGAISTQTNATNNTPVIYPTTAGNTWTSPVHIGRMNTLFLIGASVNFGNSATTCSYQATLYKVLSNGNLSSAYNTLPTYTVGCTNPYIPALMIGVLGNGVLDGTNTIPYNNYFIKPGNNNGYYVPDGAEYYVAYTLYNNCGSIQDGKYFQIDDNSYYRQDNTGAPISDELDMIKFTPVPFGKELTAHLSLDEAANTSLIITAVDGRVIANAWENEAMEKGNIVKSINTSNWPPGLYFYKLTVDGKAYAGKLQKD